jgi:hypothetical protein
MTFTNFALNSRAAISTGRKSSTDFGNDVMMQPSPYFS